MTERNQQDLVNAFVAASEQLEIDIFLACPDHDESIEHPDPYGPASSDESPLLKMVDVLARAVDRNEPIEMLEPWIVANAGGGPREIATVGPYSAPTAHTLGVSVLRGSWNWRRDPEAVCRDPEWCLRPIYIGEFGRLHDLIVRERLSVLGRLDVTPQPVAPVDVDMAWIARKVNLGRSAVRDHLAKNKLPPPDIEGSGSRPHRWRYITLYPTLVKLFPHANLPKPRQQDSP